MGWRRRRDEERYGINLRAPVQLRPAELVDEVLTWYAIRLVDGWPGPIELPETRKAWDRCGGAPSRSCVAVFHPSLRVERRALELGAIVQLYSFLVEIMAHERVEGAPTPGHIPRGGPDGRVSVWPAMTARWGDGAGTIRIGDVDFTCVPDAGALT